MALGPSISPCCLTQPELSLRSGLDQSPKNTKDIVLVEREHLLEVYHVEYSVNVMASSVYIVIMRNQ